MKRKYVPPGDPPNLRHYPLPPEIDDAELRERLRNEQRPEPRSWEDQAADDAGKPRWGEL